MFNGIDKLFQSIQTGYWSAVASKKLESLLIVQIVITLIVEEGIVIFQSGYCTSLLDF